MDTFLILNLHPTFFFPKASERRTPSIVRVCDAFSDFHIVASSHLQISLSHLQTLFIYTYHFLTFASFCLRIRTYFPIFTFPQSHLHISSSHLHIHGSSHVQRVHILRFHLYTFSPLILAFSFSVITPIFYTHHSSASYVPQMSHLDMSFCRFYTVICPHIMFTFSHPVILTSTHLVITSSHLLVISYINIQTSSSYLHIFASFRFLIFTFRPHISHHHVITCSHLRMSPPVFSSTSCFFFVSFGGGRCQRGSMTLTFLRENQVGSATTMGQSRNTFIHRHVYKQTGVRTSKIAFLLHF